MKCAVYKTSKEHVTAELTHAECVALSELAEVAAVVDLTETFGGNINVYVDGAMMQYDPVEGDIMGNHDRFAGRNGWLS